MQKLDKSALEDILNGAAFFGSGGGGSRKMGQDLIDEILRHTEVVVSIDVTDVGDDEWGAVVAGIGAPNASQDQHSETRTYPLRTSIFKALHGIGQSSIKAFELLEQILGKKFSYTLSVETGTANIFIAMLVAVYKQIPIVDCDGAGRSVPELSMTTYAATGIDVSPCPLVSKKDEDVKSVLYAKTSSDMESLIRPIISTEQFGQQGGLATYALDGQTMRDKQSVIPGAISRAWQLGLTLRKAKEQGEDPVEAALAFFQGSAFELFRGEIQDVSQQTQGGFDRGIVTVKNGDREVYVIYRNESLMAWRNDSSQPIAMAPDLICYMTPDGIPLTNADDLKEKKGQELVLIGVKAPEQLRSGSILAAFQQLLNLMGYYGPYVPLEKLHPYGDS
ncbi:DUF917 domain-containing protein [Argonema antarcticum]|uniref:DUF917 domain-containing protein n=1 Tax=Argonema antarcticum TaxID=2942763 RepID=UPI00201178F7|nr:DUF917 domain-containing protein [Argonema antarcticum]MCL1469071.1 DUF917 domain-containing protein [Argonema antarcticum A004/B2]